MSGFRFLLGLALTALALPAAAQERAVPADTAAVSVQRTADGAVVVTSGTRPGASPPGGVRIRSQVNWGDGPPRDDLRQRLARALDGLDLSDLLAPGAAGRPLTRLDLLELERSLLRRFDDRFNLLLSALPGTADPGFGPGGRRTIIVPGAPAAPGTVTLTPAPDVPAAQPPLGLPPPPALDALPRAPLAVPGVVTVQEVERALLDVGLFRAVGVNFEFDRATLMPRARQTLDQVGAVLARYPELVVAVHGHTDNIGSAAYNEQLSQRRAEAVRDYLLTTFPALSGDRIVAQGFGQERPIAENDNPTGRTLNRRVEFVVLNPDAAQRVTHTAPVPAPLVLPPAPDPAPTPDPAAAEAEAEATLERLREIIREELRRAEEARPEEEPPSPQRP